jgi:hypothetical protein
MGKGSGTVGFEQMGRQLISPPIYHVEKKLLQGALLRDRNLDLSLAQNSFEI